MAFSFSAWSSLITTSPFISSPRSETTRFVDLALVTSPFWLAGIRNPRGEAEPDIACLEKRLFSVQAFWSFPYTVCTSSKAKPENVHKRAMTMVKASFAFGSKPIVSWKSISTWLVSTCSKREIAANGQRTPHVKFLLRPQLLRLVDRKSHIGQKAWKQQISEKAPWCGKKVHKRSLDIFEMQTLNSQPPASTTPEPRFGWRAQVLQLEVRNL